MYRPVNWKNPHIVVIDGVYIDCSVEAIAFEEGAGAMLFHIIELIKVSPL